MAVTARSDDDLALDVDEQPRRPGPTIVQALVLAAALVFLTSVVTVWWVSRDPSPNAADVGFYDDMTTHHFQAIAMAYTYLDHGTDPVLRGTAKEIHFVQIGDIRQMQAALQEWHRGGTPDVAMEWMGMRVSQDAQPGMVTEAQLAALERARGRGLDDLYSRLMIDHHAGGIHMGAAAATRAHLTSVRATAASIAANQRTEITELNTRRTQIGLESYNG
jgi:uncharacterized protein (DUF305 family)